MTWSQLEQSDRVRRTAMPVVVCFAAGVVAVLWYFSKPIDDSNIEVRFTNLQDVVASQLVFYKKTTDDYVPKVQGRIDDLAVPAAEILRRLPGVASVDQPLKPVNPFRIGV
jgi:hypothetical protein